MSSVARTATGEWSKAFGAGWMLASRDWLAEARHSRSSTLWPLLYPLVYTAVVVLLRPVFAAAAGTDTWRFAAFVFIGFSLWQTWIDALRLQLGAIRRYRGLVSRGELDSRALLATSLVGGALQLAPRLAAMLPAATFMLHATPVAVLGLLVFSVLVLCNGAVIGAFLQPFATLSPGVERAVQGFSLALLMTGGVFAPLPADPGLVLALVAGANPLGVLLDAARGPLFAGMVSAPLLVGAWTAITLIGLFVAPRFGRRLLPIVTERLGS